MTIEFVQIRTSSLQKHTRMTWQCNSTELHKFCTDLYLWAFCWQNKEFSRSLGWSTFLLPHAGHSGEKEWKNLSWIKVKPPKVWSCKYEGTFVTLCATERAEKGTKDEQPFELNSAPHFVLKVNKNKRNETVTWCAFRRWNCCAFCVNTKTCSARHVSEMPLTESTHSLFRSRFMYIIILCSSWWSQFLKFFWWMNQGKAKRQTFSFRNRLKFATQRAVLFCCLQTHIHLFPSLKVLILSRRLWSVDLVALSRCTLSLLNDALSGGSAPVPMFALWVWKPFSRTSSDVRWSKFSSCWKFERWLVAPKRKGLSMNIPRVHLIFFIQYHHSGLTWNRLSCGFAAERSTGCPPVSLFWVSTCCQRFWPFSETRIRTLSRKLSCVARYTNVHLKKAKWTEELKKRFAAYFVIWYQCSNAFCT